MVRVNTLSGSSCYLIIVSVQGLCSYTIAKESKTYKPLPQTILNGPADMNFDPQLRGIEQWDISGNQEAPSNLRLFPPPLFSRQTIPQGYKSVHFLPVTCQAPNQDLVLEPIPHQWSPPRLMKKQANKRSV